MTFSDIKHSIRSGAILYNKTLALWLWFGLSFYATLFVIWEHGGKTTGNYKIFTHTFFHIRQQTNLYIQYPQEYGDVNLYGPFASIVMAPFALLPGLLGMIIWIMGNTLILYLAIKKLPFKEASITMILLLCSHELMTASSWTQSNPLLAACIIFSFYFFSKDKVEWAAFFILFGAFIKLYSIVGLAFFFFTKKPLKFIVWFLIWGIVFFIAPMLITKPSFVLQCYVDWKDALMHKSAKNVRLDINNFFQDISVMGMIRRMLHYKQLKDSVVIGTAIVLFASQYVYYKYFSDMRYRLYILCSVLLTAVIFSTSAESPTYIIAFPAVCIWYAMQQPSKWNNAMLIFAIVLTSFSHSDLLTPWFRAHVAMPYSVKALPCFVLWIVILVQVHTKQFLKTTPQLVT